MVICWLAFFYPPPLAFGLSQGFRLEQAVIRVVALGLPAAAGHRPAGLTVVLRRFAEKAGSKGPGPEANLPMPRWPLSKESIEAVALDLELIPDANIGSITFINNIETMAK